jgi:malate dehydrogenase
MLVTLRMRGQVRDRNTRVTYVAGTGTPAPFGRNVRMACALAARSRPGYNPPAMHRIAILGAGDLGATVARRLAEKELAREVLLADSDEGRARGKALDLLQSGPVEAYDTRIVGGALAATAGEWDAVVVADAAEARDGVPTAAQFLTETLRSCRAGVVVVAGARGASLVESLVASGVPRERALGSAPVAVAAALRRRLAQELGVEPREVSASLLGLPPDVVLMPQGAAAVSGTPVDRLSPVAVRRALAAVTGRTPGPVALAAAAVRLVQALAASRPSALPVTVCLQGEYGHRGVALAVPARVGEGCLLSVLEIALEPVDRVALDNAAERRFSAHGRRT